MREPTESEGGTVYNTFDSEHLIDTDEMERDMYRPVDLSELPSIPVFVDVRAQIANAREKLARAEDRQTA